MSDSKIKGKNNYIGRAKRLAKISVTKDEYRKLEQCEVCKCDGVRQDEVVSTEALVFKDQRRHELSLPSRNMTREAKWQTAVQQ